MRSLGVVSLIFSAWENYYPSQETLVVCYGHIERFSAFPSVCLLSTNVEVGNWCSTIAYSLENKHQYMGQAQPAKVLTMRLTM